MAVCLPADVHVFAVEVIPDETCNCIGILTPYAWAQTTKSVGIKMVIDGDTHFYTFTLPPQQVGTPTPICLYTNDPFSRFDCLL